MAFLMKEGTIDSAIVPAPFGKGISLEAILESHGISTPGSCVAKVDDTIARLSDHFYALQLT